MHVVYKLFALSVVFSLVLTGPVAKTTDPEFDDLAYEGDFNAFHDEDMIPVVGETRNVGVGNVGIAVPKLSFVGILGVLFSIVPKLFKIVGLKIKVITLVAKFIKWLAPKAIFIAIGAIAILAFCKLTGLFSLEYDPVVAELVPSQVRSFVTPDRLQEAQELLASALQLYMKEQMGH